MKTVVSGLLIGAALVCGRFAQGGEPSFLRGDCNRDSLITLADSVFLLAYLNLDGESPSCNDACDSDDSGVLEADDAMYVLSYLNQSGPRPPEPFPYAGPDPTEDALGCERIDVAGSWIDTQERNSMEVDDTLFEAILLDDQLVLGTTSELWNIHSHFITDDRAQWQNYEFRGKMRCDAQDGGVGVTFFSDYPIVDHYYRLRRYLDNEFHIAPHGTEITEGNTSTGVIPEAGVWYDFRVQVSDTGERTRILANVWRHGETEPNEWQVDCSDSSPTRRTSGTVGCWTHRNGAKFYADLEVNGQRLRLPQEFALHLEAADTELGEGDSTSFTVTRTTSGGSEDVSHLASFEVADPTVLAVTAGSPAIATGLQTGETTVFARLDGRPSNTVTVNVTAPAIPSAFSVHQFGITWFFDRDYPVGQFVNGDFWVVGPVTVVSIDPPSVPVNGRVKNGSMVNVMPGLDHGWDSSLYGGTQDRYDELLNVSFELEPNDPLVLAPGSSLISSISREAAGVKPGLKTAAVLTVVDSPPPADAFRPPYAGSTKPLFRLSQARTEHLGNLPGLSNIPDPDEVAGFFERVWLEHINTHMSKYQHPEDNMPWYGRDMSWQLGTAALLLQTNIPLAEKELLLIRFLQVGIDYDQLRQIGVTWAGNGAHMIGRKFPIMFKRAMFGQNPNLGDDPTRFSEDDQTFYVEETSPGVYNFGYPNRNNPENHPHQCVGFHSYGPGQLGMPEWSNRHWSANPVGLKDAGHTWSDGPTMGCSNDNHRSCCTYRTLAGHFLAAYAMNLRTAWNWEPAFDYIDRYTRISPNPQKHWDPWVQSMWNAHRGSFGGYSDVPSSWIPVDL